MIRILYVDDEEALLEITKAYLERSGGIWVDVISSGVEADHILSQKCYDVIVADYQMPEMSGIDLLKSIRARRDPTPFILFTGKGREEVVIEALNAGADFYLQKGGEAKAQFTELESKIRVAVKRVKAEDEVEIERAKAQKYLDIAGVMFVALDTKGVITLINKRGCQILGCEADLAVGKNWFEAFVPESNRSKVIEIYQKIMAGQLEQLEYYENPVLTQNGDEKIIAWHNSVIRDDDGKIVGTLSSGGDITNKRKTEQALLDVSARFESMQNHMLEMFFVMDFEGNLLEANQAAIDLSGYDRDEFMAINIFSLVPEEQLPPVVDAIDEVIRTGNQRKWVEVQLKRKDGRYVEIETSGSLLSRDGIPYAIEGIARDITERKKSEKTLTASESRYRRLFETAMDGILIIDEWSGEIIDANPFILDLTGFGLDEVIGKRFWEIGFLEDKELSRKAFATLKKEGYLRYDGIPMKTKGGAVLDVEFVSNTYQVDGAKIIQCNVRDVTERRKTEEQLSIINNKLNLLTSITRHDILNQISVVLGYLELQKQVTTEKGRRELQAKAERAVLEIQQQIEFTHDYQQTGTSKPQWQVLSDVLRKMPMAKEIKSIHLAENLEGTKVYADPMLGKVFHNLFSNSIKHGECVSEVKIDCLDHGDSLLLVYEDNGKGIRVEQKDIVFEKGFNASSGHGLFLSREILAVTGISIIENGIPGKGARFEMLLPKGAFELVA